MDNGAVWMTGVNRVRLREGCCFVRRQRASMITFHGRLEVERAQCSAALILIIYSFRVAAVVCFTRAVCNPFPALAPAGCGREKGLVLVSQAVWRLCAE